MNFIRRTVLSDSLALAFLTAILIGPLFHLTYLNNWPSIESTFISDARMLGGHLPHPGWQPLWYCGTRFDYIYPPALRYGTALISRAGGILPARAYHLYIAFFYVFGIVAVYWLVRVGTASRGAALLASAATALLSPSFLLLAQIRHDSGFWVPQRLHVLMSWGEGPHISALGILPAALAAAFVALRRWRPRALAAAGALCALVVANNFYGATALALFYPVAVWAVWVGQRNRAVWIRAAAIPLIAYGLCAFWLTPSYVRTTLMDLKLVSLPGNTSSRVILLVVVAFYCLFSLAAASRRPEREWAVFVYGAAAMMSVYVLGHAYFDLRIAGDAERLVPELDLALTLASVEVMRRLWGNPRLRLPVGLLVLFAFFPAVRYLKHGWSPFPGSAPLENVYEYKTVNWVHEHLAGARVLPAGTLRFWFDAWSDNAQTAGGSDQGILNQTLPIGNWQILHGDRGDLAALWLRALGTDAVIVPGRKSFEYYRDYEYPEKFKGVLTALYDDQHETVIYGTGRIHSGIARIVDRAAMDGVGRIRGGDDAASLTKYLEVVENPAQNAANLTWRGFDQAEIDAKMGTNQSLLIQETWDPSWHAYENGRKLSIRPENTMGFMLVDASEGPHRIEMRFETPIENRAGQVLFVVTLIIAIFLAFSG